MKSVRSVLWCQEVRAMIEKTEKSIFLFALFSLPSTKFALIMKLEVYEFIANENTNIMLMTILEVFRPSPSSFMIVGVAKVQT